MDLPRQEPQESAVLTGFRAADSRMKPSCMGREVKSSATEDVPRVCLYQPAALAAAFLAFLKSRTICNVSGLVTSATDRYPSRA